MSSSAFDRSGWAAKLRTDLDHIRDDYSLLRKVAATGLDDEGMSQDTSVAQAAATAAATQALIRIAIALDEIPALKGSLRDGPVPDLIAALDDLRRGQSPEFFRPWPKVSGRLSTRTEMLKVRAVTSVMVMKRSGVGDTEACSVVARIFAEAGHRGKKGGALSASTVFAWVSELTPGVIETREQQLIAETMSRLPQAITRPEAIRLTRLEAAKRL